MVSEAVQDQDGHRVRDLNDTSVGRPILERCNLLGQGTYKGEGTQGSRDPGGEASSFKTLKIWHDA